MLFSCSGLFNIVSDLITANVGSYDCIYNPEDSIEKEDCFVTQLDFRIQGHQADKNVEKG